MCQASYLACSTHLQRYWSLLNIFVHQHISTTNRIFDLWDFSSSSRPYLGRRQVDLVQQQPGAGAQRAHQRALLEREREAALGHRRRALRRRQLDPEAPPVLPATKKICCISSCKMLLRVYHAHM